MSVRTSDLKPTPEAALVLAGLEGIYSGYYAKTLTAAGLIIYGLSVNHLRQDPKKYISKSSHLIKKKILHCLTGLPCHLLPLNFFPKKSSQKTEPLKLCFLPHSVFFEVLSVAEANALAVSALFSEDGLHRGNP